MDTPEDSAGNRRRQYRYIRHDKLFVQLLTDNEKLDTTNVTIFCHSCDASISGIRIELEIELEVASQVDLWISFEGLDGKLYLHGHVCWCSRVEGEDKLYKTGIEIEDTYATDYKTWIKLLKNYT